MKGTVNYREINNAVMTDTMEMCSMVESLKKSIDNSIKNEYVVYQSEPLNAGDIQKNLEMKVLVSKKRTFEAAEAYKGKKICCLDFANYYSMGGAPWSAGAQEESMCRISTLYPCLYAQKNDYYEKHFLEEEKGEIDDMGGHDLIYIPGVTVFKTDESIPKLKDEETWFNTDVIVSAAPALYDKYDKNQYRQVMTERIKRILDLAAKEKVEVLILGAFGCGAFENPKTLIPVRPKNDFNSENLYYSEDKKDWCPLSKNADDKNVFSEENLGGLALEFVESPLNPPSSFLSIKTLKTFILLIIKLADLQFLNLKITVPYRWKNSLSTAKKKGVMHLISVILRIKME